MSRSALASAVALCAALCLPTSAALACGGLFCAVTITTPEPVDQNAERIIFAMRDGEITAHVQIEYAGSPERFAWVVPVPTVPEVRDSDEQIFQDLDDTTAMQIVPPPTIPCPQPSSSGSFGGCGASEASAGFAAPTALEDGGANSGVTVFDHGYTDNYEYHVVGAVDTAELVAWLQDNDYNVSDNMTPVMDVYNGPDGKFLALKLQAGKDARDIVPVAMTYDSEFPMVPIRLTAVAAQPLMGILVWILAETPYVPSNYGLAQPSADDLLFDVDDNFTGTTNYFAWASRESDEADGQKFIREYAGANPIQDWWYEGNFELDHTWVTRLYTRMSPHHMTKDPVFGPDPDLTTFDGVLDFSGHPELIDCGSVIEERRPSPCSRTYCGRDGTCAVHGGQVGCVCPADEVAQAITGPDGLPTVTCVPRSNDFGVTDDASGVGTDVDPCNGYDCGDGSCVVKGGFPTCDCNTDSIACVEGTVEGLPGGLSCVPPTPDTEFFGPGGGLESAAFVPVRGEGEPAAPRAYAVPRWIVLLLVLGAALLWRRRRFFAA